MVKSMNENKDAMLLKYYCMLQKYENAVLEKWSKQYRCIKLHYKEKIQYLDRLQHMMSLMCKKNLIKKIINCWFNCSFSGNQHFFPFIGGILGIALCCRFSSLS